MTNLAPSMRLKVKRDTFFIPDSNDSVYFRNNSCSFRIEGRTINQWVEKLLPMFNGEHTLEDLTNGLSVEHRDQIYKIAELLYQNGFVRDVSKDLPHQMPEQVLKKYAFQIEFLENVSDSGAHRFESYRQAKVLAIGSGPFFVSLIAALLESGLPKIHMLMMKSVPTNRQRLEELAAYASKTDPQVELEEVSLGSESIDSLREVLRPFDWILYTSQEGDIDELRILHTFCREEKKVLLPAIVLQQVGLAGPSVHPDSEGCWESAWRRLHHSALSQDSQSYGSSSTAVATLANVIVFELFKKVTGVAESVRNNQFYLLNLETLEGNWHSFIPHPLITETSAKRVQDPDLLLERHSGRNESSGLLSYFSSLTSEISGIFHIWEEGELKQLPLAQCRVQVADALSEGPTPLLTDITCTGMTHEEARREAGLAGIEAYVSRMTELPITSPQKEVNITVDSQEFVGVGAGETVAEGIARGLQKCLTEELEKQRVNQKLRVFRFQLNKVEDEQCLFYLQALTTMKGAPKLGMGEEMCGFPVVWVGTGEHWYSSVGLNVTMALRKALQQALSTEQNKAAYLETKELKKTSVLLEEKDSKSLVIPACEETPSREMLKSAMQVLKYHHKQLLVLDLALEPFLKKQLAGVFGVLFQKEESK
ncbi:putative thiazole-containing bacteriocin maturation protein [Alteribacillus bidgolensis]|uniref:Putative thiazole-containing bacteriocin maturation protein n=1 Tax=Alteribacillus bidgolensis TaxID=930129 RepID=A0A1G8RA14_9BACI|nr:putative thiazole-containing bacteriocin maturation protein [Alteribacillus bidgolensis]SDJ13375.1 putative thiazole-containing bacteriocin maturation protein [Alteribacillus bidgolensis]